MNTLRKFVVPVAVAGAFGVLVAGAEARESERYYVDADPKSLASPNYDGYRPAWANPYAQPQDLGVNDDPTPFDPADVDSGPDPLDPHNF